jgi:hypothetical protein
MTTEYETEARCNYNISSASSSTTAVTTTQKRKRKDDGLEAFIQLERERRFKFCAGSTRYTLHVHNLQNRCTIF